MMTPSEPENPNRLTPDERNEIMRRLGRALRPALADVVEQGLPGPMLQMLSLLERVEEQKSNRDPPQQN